MGRIFMDLDTGMRWSEESYKELCMMQGMTSLAYEEHVRQIIKESEEKSKESYGELLKSTYNLVNWKKDAGPLTREKMAECIDNFFGDCEGMPGILKESVDNFKKTMLGHFKEEKK